MPAPEETDDFADYWQNTHPDEVYDPSKAIRISPTKGLKESDAYSYDNTDTGRNRIQGDIKVDPKINGVVPDTHDDMRTYPDAGGPEYAALGENQKPANAPSLIGAYLAQKFPQKRVDLDIGKAQVIPPVGLDIGKAQVTPPVGLDIGPVQIQTVQGMIAGQRMRNQYMQPDGPPQVHPLNPNALAAQILMAPVANYLTNSPHPANVPGHMKIWRPGNSQSGHGVSTFTPGHSDQIRPGVTEFTPGSWQQEQ